MTFRYDQTKYNNSKHSPNKNFLIMYHCNEKSKRTDTNKNNVNQSLILEVFFLLLKEFE